MPLVNLKIDEEKAVDRAASWVMPWLHDLTKQPLRVQGTIGGVQVDLTIQTGDSTK